MGRQPCCDKIGLKRGSWTIDEDQKLINFILNNGIQCWRRVPKLAGLMRCGKSCRLRWTNYLRPDLKRGAFSEAEEDQIIELHSRLGNRWSKIASYFPGRTDNEIKNHWNTKIKKKMKLLGLDPVTHKPVEQPGKCSLQGQKASNSASSASKVEEQSQETSNLVDDEGQGNKDEVGIELPDNGNVSWWELGSDEGEMKARNHPSSSSSTSFFLDDTCADGSAFGWPDASSWDALYYFEDIFPFDA